MSTTETDSNASTQLVWLITGTSSGLGLSLTKAVLERSDNVIATSRSPDSSLALLDLQSQHPDNCKLLRLDVTDTFDNIKEVAKKAIGMWGRVDVLVNNAGYAIIGSVEEAGAELFHEIYKTNVYGPINITNAFLPHMRERKSGTVVFIGSRSGWRTNLVANGLYGSSKAALHGGYTILLNGSLSHEYHVSVAIADALSAELAPFSIRVLNAIPGGIRTRNLNNAQLIDSDRLASTILPDYASMRAVVRQYLSQINGKQTGDPVRMANVIVDIVRGEGVMRTGDHLLENVSGGKVDRRSDVIAGIRPWTNAVVLGSDAVRDVRAKCEVTIACIEEWADVPYEVDIVE